MASEVKELANQTAKATEEIGRKIGEIQSATGGCGSVYLQDRLDHRHHPGLVGAIAGAVEQQGAATEEIASNTQKAAQGASDVTRTIAGVGTAAEMTGAASTQLMALSEDLKRQSADLQNEVAEFVGNLRDALPAEARDGIRKRA